MYTENYSTQEWNALSFEKKCEIKANGIKEGKLSFVIESQPNSRTDLRIQKKYCVGLYDEEDKAIALSASGVIQIIPDVSSLRQYIDDNCTNRSTIEKVLSYL